MAGVRLRWCVVAAGLLCSVPPENVFPQAGFPLRHWIYFKDKGSQDIRSFSASPLSLGISPRALKRRAKVLPPEHLIDERDLPVAQEYLDQLRSRGLKVRSISRWMNSASVEISPEKIAEIRLFQFVTSVEAVATVQRPELLVSSIPPSAGLFKGEQRTALDYGPSLTQVQNMRVPDVHNLGINGSGILVGMIDDGFNNYKLHNALKNIPIVAEFDYIQGDSNTSSEKDDAPGQGDHGAATMSVLAGFESGKLIGSAYGVSLILAKSEYDPTETQIELDNYVAALEWMERLGADIVSTSLGYDDLDPYRVFNPGDIVYSMKDGKTAVTSKAGRVAASKGVLLVTAMGNEGPWRYDDNWQLVNGQTGSLVTPADADSIVAVGATYSDRLRVDFSSTGPTADGRIKPEVVAQGTAIFAANGKTTTAYIFTQGTSFSTPLTAGVAALILSAHPQLAPMQVREALTNTAMQVNDTDPEKNITSWPNNWYGYGFVNAFEAVLYHGLVFSNRPSVSASDSLLLVSTLIMSKSGIVADSVFLYYRQSSSTVFQQVKMVQTSILNEFQAAIPRSKDETTLGYFFAKENSGVTRLSPSGAPDSLFVLSFVPPENFFLHNNYPNPFNGFTTIKFDVPFPSNVSLTIYNILGQKIRSLYNGFTDAGSTNVRWDGRDEFGRIVASGVYFYHLLTPSSAIAKKLLYMK